MSVRMTSTTDVALFDSVSGWAFGPTFPSESAARDFLQYTADGPDLRTLSPPELEQQYSAWIGAHGADFGFDLSDDFSDARLQ